MNEYYKEALRLAQKDYRMCVVKGKSPCLPVMDDFVSQEKITTGINLGLSEIPLKLIVGTKSRGRVNAFAPNFMPILEETTEFADKWKNLCQSHLTEGIRDPIKVYEYMYRYYVEEGNKRVSVMKFFDAYSIVGNVTRILPEKTEDEAVQMYYEFVEFNKFSRINFIEFSKKGSYKVLNKLLGKAEGELWSEDERKVFSSVYCSFEKAYTAVGGDKLSTTVGDAMLSYIQVYGYAQLLTAENADIRKNLKKMWEDITLKGKGSTIELKPTPAEEKKPNIILSAIAFPKQSVWKVAFVHDGNPEKSGWVNDHEQGRLHVECVFGDKLATTAYTDAMESDPLKVIEQAIADGNKLIFTTSPRMLQASLRAAVEHPDIVIMNCSLNISHRYVRTYYTRMYEAKFILGVLAGALSESGRLGYVCDYPIFGQIAGINAFALGAQMTNPRSKVFLEWSSVKGAKNAALSLTKQDIHIISSQDTARFQNDDRHSFGLSRIHDGKSELLAVPVWKWGIYYEEILRRMFNNNTVKDEYANSSRALNYYWGMSAGVVDIEYAGALPLASRRCADFFRETFIHDFASPFLTPFYTQKGDIMGKGQKSLTLEQIISMDYLVENVVGDIPAYDELTYMGKATVDVVGVEKSQTNSVEE